MSRGEPAWKKVERRIARFFGTERNPLSGGNSKHSRSDSLHPRLFIETKHGAGCPRTWPKTLNLFAEVEVRASAEGKVALLVLHNKRVAHVDDYDSYVRVRTDPPGTFVACVPLWMAKKLLELERETGSV